METWRKRWINDRGNNDGNNRRRMGTTVRVRKMQRSSAEQKYDRTKEDRES